MQIEAVDDDETFKDVVVFIISHFLLCCVCTGLFLLLCGRENFMYYIPTRTRLSPPGNSHLLWWPEKEDNRFLGMKDDDEAYIKPMACWTESSFNRRLSPVDVLA